ncbi:MAG: hypothetical protein KIT87_05665 [Anaerolineae bacterium]|nr:hypothetical protein [Anaerolineae bacterium]
MRPPQLYHITVQGHLDAAAAAWFEGWAVTHWSDGTTTLTGVVPDQAALHGRLNAVFALGLTLLAVQRQVEDRPLPQPLP